MDNLYETIASLPAEDVREFKLFINRQRKKKNRKDLELFDLLRSRGPMRPKEVSRKLYNDYKRNAYHSIRKRLFRHLIDFLLLKQKDNDATTSSSVMGMISLVKYLFDKRLNAMAWLYLEKAEELAQPNEQFDLLNTVYHLQIEHFSSSTGKDLKSIIKKRNENKKLLEEDERTILAKSIIQNELQSVIIKGIEINFELIISRVLKECDLDGVIARRPKLLFNIVSIARSAILANKDYFSFEPYIINLYEEAEQKFGFTKSSHHYKLSLLYMISHVLFRNRKFPEAEKYLKKMHSEMEQFNSRNYAAFYPNYLQLLAVVKSYIGLNDQAISLHEEAIKSKMKFDSRDELNIRLNLAVYYFNAGQFKKANQVFISYEHSDKWYEKKLGKEWVLRKNLMEIFTQYELGNEDIALNRIRSVERHFEEFFQNIAYKRVKVFLGLVKDFLNDPSAVSGKAFSQKVMDSKIFLPDDYEDLRAIAFFCWLKSKMVKQPYYKVLVERMNTRLQIQ